MEALIAGIIKYSGVIVIVLYVLDIIVKKTKTPYDDFIVDVIKDIFKKLTGQETDLSKAKKAETEKVEPKPASKKADIKMVG